MRQLHTNGSCVFNPGGTHGQGHQNYDVWILWQMNWQMFVLMTGKGKTPKTREIWRKTFEEAKAHPALLATEVDDDDVCVYGVYKFEILNKFVSTAFSLFQFNN